MVLIPISVDGETKQLFMDDGLNRNLDEKILPEIQKKDNDVVFVVDGPERSGKSVFAMQLAKKLDPTFCIDRMCMTSQEFKNTVLHAKKNQAIVYDEAFTGLSSRASLSDVNKILVELMMEMGQKNLIIIVVMPTYFMLDRYVALFRSRGLFHIYKKGTKRGFWRYYNMKRKKILYLLGKRTFDYSKPRTNLRGRFLDMYTVNEASYRQKKNDSLMGKKRLTKDEKYKQQRDILFYILNAVLSIPQEEISIQCKNLGIDIEQNTISEIVAEIRSKFANNAPKVS